MRQAVRHEKTEFYYYYSVNKAKQGRGKYQRDTTDDTLRHDKSLKHVFFISLYYLSNFDALFRMTQ